MFKNNLIRFVHSLALLPLLTGTVSILATIPSSYPENPEIVLSQKQNIEALHLLSFNQTIESETKKITEISKLRAEAIDAYFDFYEMPLSGTGEIMVQMAEKYNLDWRLLPAIAVRESTGGKFACKKATYNSFGWGSCKVNFESNEHAIETIAKNLAGQNPNTAEHYKGKDTEGILLAYNPPSIVPRYVPQVMAIMEKIGEKELGVEKTILLSAI